MEKISIVVPVYNVEPYLPRCVDSILSQTYGNFSLLLIDDGSPDACGKVCDDYARKDPRITVIHQENSGVSAARNLGIEWTLNHPEYQWLTFIDGDDWIHPMYLEVLVHATSQFRLKIGQVNLLKVHETIPYPNYAEISPILLTTGEAYQIYGFSPCGKLFHTSLLKDIRFPVGVRHEDEFTTYRILFSQSHVAYINKTLYYYYVRANSFMCSQWTTDHLACLDARDEQLAFFEAKGLRSEYTYIYGFYLSDLESCYRNICKSSLPDRADLLRKIRKRIRSVLRHHGPAPKPTVKNHPVMYNIAYPGLAYLYWSFQGFLAKLKSYFVKF